MDALWQQIQHFALNPPFAPGGREGEGILPDMNRVNVGGDGDGGGDSFYGDGDGDVGPLYGEERRSDGGGVIVRYFPLLLLLIIFWPVVVTLAATSFSASAWLLWLFVSLLFGLIQMVFVTYNFGMIFWDLAALTVLKTFAMLRSLVRYYTHKAADRVSGRGGRGPGVGRGSKRRRKEWRENLDGARNFDDYRGIKIYEPAGGASPPAGSGRVTSTAPSFRRLAVGGTPRPGKPPRPPGSPMRKAASCLNLPHRDAVAAKAALAEEEAKAPKRILSFNALEEEERRKSTDNDCPVWKQIVQEDLGMTGNLLLATMSRLRETRLQASSESTTSGVSLGSSPVSNFAPPSASSSRKSSKQSRGGESGDVGNDGNGDGDEESSHADVRGGGGGEQIDAGDASSSLKFLLSGIIKRNHLSVDDVLVDDARSVAERGQHSLRAEARDAIRRYGDELERCVDWVASGPLLVTGRREGPEVGGASLSPPSQPQPQPRPPNSREEEICRRQREELLKRHKLVKRMKHNMGRTALMLSGGGAQAMYHLGTIKALVESGLYEHIHVISGTSGGSITAAMCAIKSPLELHRDVCVKTVSTDYLHTGEMKRRNIRWFPELVKMGAYWLKHKLLVDSADFKQCCEFYYGETTFEEAFEITGKHVCITVSANRATAGSGSGAQRLLLNHVSTPDVTLASAVAASCALPGVMAPAKLMVKDGHGKLHPFEVDGVEWIDGSVQADLPFKRISTLFNVSNYVVAQTNFHVVPFMNKAHHPNIRSLYWKVFQMCEWDIRSRALNLSRLGLFPRLFGQDFAKIFKQKYHGNLTLVPRFTTLQVFGLKALVNPTVEDMITYLQNGQIAAWPFLGVIKEMLRMERAIDNCLAKLEQRIRSVASDLELQFLSDDLDSISSAVDAAHRARLPGLGREAELLKEKVHKLENENLKLKKQVTQLQRTRGIKQSSDTMKTLEGRCISITRVEEDETLENDPAHQDEKKDV